MHKIEKVTLPNVKHIIAIASGKGGVGKSTIAANLALAFAQNGYKTALVDADLFGPSIPILFGLENQQLIIEQRAEKHVMIPFEKNKIKLMSVGFLVNSEQALIWRGPMASSVLLQLFSETDWGEVDYMIVDLPPGTGDIPLTLCQQVDIDGVIIVTTPQKLSFADVQKAISMFKNPDINKPIIGIIENMSWFTPIEHPDEKYFLFGKGGGQYLAKKFNSELLLQIPLMQDLCDATDRGFLSDFSKRPEILGIYKELIRKIRSKFN